MRPDQVRRRVERGEINLVRDPRSRTLWAILRANVLTKFNAILGMLLAAILVVGPLRDALFGISMIVNSLIGIIQEFRAKRVLDRLAVVAVPTARVVRSGHSQEIPIRDIVRDDVLDLRAGDQIAVDAEVLTSCGLEMDESLLSGESHSVPKDVGHTVLSGSLVASGSGRARATRIGEESYGRRLAAQARKFELTRSELRADIDAILNTVTWLLLPVGLLLIVRQLNRDPAGWEDAVRGTIAALEGMIPQGLVVLASLVMAISIVRMGRRNVLIQELAAVEMLARIDILCLDKTGTLTTGEIRMSGLLPIAVAPTNATKTFAPEDLRSGLGVLARAAPDSEPTLHALSQECSPDPGPEWDVVGRVPFSWSRRWSSVSTRGRGNWVLGAPEVLFEGDDEKLIARDHAARLAGAGERVLALGWGPDPVAADGGLPSELRPVALVTLRETIREGARDVLRFFEAQGVQIKVISGDHPRTVDAIARELGLRGIEPSPDSPEPDDVLSDRFAEHVESAAVFGRVTPERKKDIILALRRRGHVVAMVGDGLNDIPALKSADLGVALRTAAPATRAVAKIVTLGGFSEFPALVTEGRCVIANVERTANLFVSKTCYVLVLAAAVTLAGLPFPLLPRQLTLIGSLSIGIPAFFISLTAISGRATPGFTRRVLRFALPAGLASGAAALLAFGAGLTTDAGDLAGARTAAALALAEAGLLLPRFIPLSRKRLSNALFVGMNVVVGTVLAIPPLRRFLALEVPAAREWLAIGGASVLAYLLFWKLLPRTGQAHGAK